VELSVKISALAQMINDGPQGALELPAKKKKSMPQAMPAFILGTIHYLAVLTTGMELSDHPHFND
jgi:hypothetical protein